MSAGGDLLTPGRPTIQLTGVRKRFGERTVVDVADLRLGAHPIEGLIGPNGAGKTTLMRLIMRSTSLDAGTVVFSEGASGNGHATLSDLAPHQIAGLGVVKSNQIIQEFRNLTIWDSLLLAVAERDDERPRRMFRERRLVDAHGERIQGYLDQFHFEDPNGFAHSAGERKLLDLIRCLLLNPKVLLLDEPTAGLPKGVTERVMELIRAKAADGMSVVIVEHDLDVIWGLSDMVHFMAEGSVILDGDAATIRANETVVEKYLGAGHV